MKITKPELVIDKKKVFRNIDRIKNKISRSVSADAPEIRFRPHFKTHQSHEIGDWFRHLGVDAITVSSLEMAAFFAKKGWMDITVAVLVNLHEIDKINQLTASGELKLNLLVDSVETIRALEQGLNKITECWLKIDTGYHRTGILWSHRQEILKVAGAIREAANLKFKGILTHPGHSYDIGSISEIKEVYHDSVSKLQYIRDLLKQASFETVEISYGDTPTCSVMETYYGIDEVRPGNFVYYDAMQLALQTCTQDDIAAVVMCPVIGKYPWRNEVVVYGGAVHLSKDSLVNSSGQSYYGLVARPDQSCQQWGPVLEDTYVTSVSQEHGIIKTSENFKIGDILAIIPIHSCLAANLLI